MKNVNPELLQHPNIPRPLHGVNPRSINGQAWWNTLRKKVYAERDQHCFACGVHRSKAWPQRRLECHESYSIDYKNALMEIDGFVALCPACHSFIHSGKLAVMLETGLIEKSTCERIMDHGLSILDENNLSPSFATYIMISSNQLPIPEKHREMFKIGKIKQGVKCGEDWKLYPEHQWLDWKMKFDNKLYGPIYKTEIEWLMHYTLGV